MAILGAEKRLLTISRVNPDPIKGIPQVDFRKIFNLIELIYKIPYEG